MVIGPQKTASLIFPFKLHGTYGQAQDCLQSNTISVHIKFRPNGSILGLFQNHSLDPQHVTPNMKAFFIQDPIDLAWDTNHKPIPLRTIKHVLPITKSNVKHMFPYLFEAASFSISSDMQALCITPQDIHWSPYTRWMSDTRFQPISTCESSAVLHTLDDLEAKHIIKRMLPNEKGFYSQCLVIPKKSGAPRITIDCRRVNTYTGAWSTALPPAQSLLHTIPQQWRFFTLLDVQNGFFNIPISTSLQHMFCFAFADRHYKFTRLPQGWSPSSSIFHSLLQKILTGTGCITYIDDVLLGGSTVEEHDARLLHTLKKLSQFGFHLAYDKLQIRQTKVTFLGFTIQGNSYSMEDFAAQLHQKIPHISSKTTLQSALGLLNGLRRFVPHFASMAQPFYALTRDLPTPPPWPKINTSFKQMLTSMLSKQYRLHRPPPRPHYHLYTDWSGTAGGYALFANSHLIWLGSRTNTLWQKHVSSFLGELSVLVWALKDSLWLHRGHTITIHSDSHSAIQKLNHPHLWPKETDGRILRLLGFILDNYEIQENIKFAFISGCDNKLADMLSRWADNGPSHPIASLPLQPSTDAIISKAHFGHFGLEITMANLQAMGHHIPRAQVSSFIKHCKACQAFHAPRKQPPLGHITDGLHQGELISIDFIGKLKTTSQGHKYIFTIIDNFTRWAEAHNTSCANSTVSIQFLENWISKHSKPKRILCDCASYFNADQFRFWARRHGILLLYTPPYSHHSNGLIERYNNILIGRIRRLLAEKNLQSSEWDQTTNYATAAIQYAHSPNLGTSPLTLRYGKTRLGATIPSPNLARLQQEATKRIHRRRTLANRSRRPSITSLPVGSSVWLFKYQRASRLDDKFAPYWHGPFIVVQRVSPHIYKIRRPTGGRLITAHIEGLKPYHD